MLSESNVSNASNVEVLSTKSESNVSNFELFECVRMSESGLKPRRYIYTQKIVYALASEKGIPGTA